MERRLEVRAGSIVDLDAVWPLARDFAVSFRPEREQFERTFRRVLSSTQALLLVAVLRGHVVGYLLAHRHDTFLADGPVAWVEEVMVDAATRRTGVGRALMTAAETWAAAEGCVYVSLASRRAGDFYLALGYEDSARFFKKTFERPGTRSAA